MNMIYNDAHYGDYAPAYPPVRPWQMPFFTEFIVEIMLFAAESGREPPRTHTTGNHSVKGKWHGEKHQNLVLKRQLGILAMKCKNKLDKGQQRKHAHINFCYNDNDKWFEAALAQSIRLPCLPFFAYIIYNLLDHLKRKKHLIYSQCVWFSHHIRHFIFNALCWVRTPFT